MSSEEGFGGLLRKSRLASGLTQEELADAARISTRTVSDLERGINRSARNATARLLADALGLAGSDRAAFLAAARGRETARETARETPPGGTAAAMCTLPRDISNFTGRDAELASLVTTIAGAADDHAVVGIHAVDGMAGIGKTALAVHAAHRLAPRFPDGQFFLPLHGHTPGQRPVDPAEALATLLLTIGVPAAQIPDGLEARIARWRDQLARKTLLLVLDDAAGHAQVRPLLPGSGRSAVLVTSRRHLTALDEATSISLDILSGDEARTLLANLADRADVRQSDPDVGRITRLCGYLPLAVGMIARQLHHHPSWTPTDLATELAEAMDRPEMIRTENLTVAAAFDLSYAELSPGQQLLFRRLGVSPGEDADAYAAAALADISPALARRELAELYDHHLLTEPVRGRFRLHDLLREHARTRAGTDDPAADTAAAVRRLVTYYQTTALLADAHLARLTRPGLKGALADAPAGPPLHDREQARAWLLSERENLLACIARTTKDHQYSLTLGLTAALASVIRSNGPWAQAAELHTAAAAVARSFGDRTGEADALVELADIRQLSGDYPASLTALERATAIYQALDDRLGLANALLQEAEIRRFRGDYAEAETQARSALDSYRDLGDLRGQAAAFRLLGKVLIVTDDYQGAMTLLEQAVASSRDLGDVQGQASALSELGVALYAIDDYPGAIAALEQALELNTRHDSRFSRAYPLLQLSVVLQAVDDYPGALAAVERARRIYEEFGNKLGTANAWCNVGAIRSATGDYQGASAALLTALDLYGGLGHRLGAGHAYDDLAEVSYLTGDLDAAEDLLDQAERSYQALGHAHGLSSVLKNRGTVRRLAGDYAEADRLFRRALVICRDLGDRIGEADTLTRLGDLQRARGDSDLAFAAYRDGREIAAAIGSKYTEARALEGLGRCELAVGDTRQAAAALHAALELYQAIGVAEAPLLAAELDGTPPGQ